MDWATHFQGVSRGRGRPKADFGVTLFGQYTIAELRDLVAAKDVEVNVLTKDGHAFLPTWSSKDPGAASAWQSDLQKLTADYAASRASAQTALDAAGAPGTMGSIFADNRNPAGDAPYKRLMATLNPRWESHDASTDRVGTLRSRLAAAGATMSRYTVPQPGAHSDYRMDVVTHPSEVLLPHEVREEAGKLWQDSKDKVREVADWGKYIKYGLLGLAGLATLLLFTAAKSIGPVAGGVARAYLPPSPNR
jgi:hypothetical protein